jgi:hypothetical protein
MIPAVGFRQLNFMDDFYVGRTGNKFKVKFFMWGEVLAVSKLA